VTWYLTAWMLMQGQRKETTMNNKIDSSKSETSRNQHMWSKHKKSVLLSQLTESITWTTLERQLLIDLRWKSTTLVTVVSLHKTR
jgi:hypothetical protein